MDGTDETQFHTTSDVQARKWFDEGMDKPVFEFDKRFLEGAAYNVLPGVRVPQTVKEGQSYTVHSLYLPDGQG